MTLQNLKDWRIPKADLSKGTLTTARPCSAIRLVHDGGNTASLGNLQTLPGNLTVDLVADGYNERTVMIRHENAFYFVFREDLTDDRSNISI